MRDASVIALGALADAVVRDIIRGEDLQYSVALRHAADLIRDERPLGIWGARRDDRAAFDRFAPQPGHCAHMPIDELREALVEMRAGGGSDSLWARVQGFFSATAAAALAATAAPGCGSFDARAPRMV